MRRLSLCLLVAVLLGTATTPAAAAMVFRGDFSTGDISQYQNWQTQYLTGPIVNKGLAENFTTGPIVVPGPFGQFSVPAGGSRSELIPGVLGTEGSDWWVSWWVRLGSTVNLSSTRAWQTIGQFHQTAAGGSGSPPLRVGIRAVQQPVWELESGPNIYPQQSILGPLAARGVWTHMLLHIRFSHTAPSGFVSWWANGKEYATQWHPRNALIYPGDTGTYPKIGYHRWGANQPAATVQVGDYLIATTLAEVSQPCIGCS